MHIYFLSLFPDLIHSYFSSGMIIQKALTKEKVQYTVINLRDYVSGKHCDDMPYGGGSGMVLRPEPLALALDHINIEKKIVIFPSPGGKIFNNTYARQFSLSTDLVFICGAYEGIDQRIIDLYVDYEISIGDYILRGGELSSLVMVDAIIRWIPNLIQSKSLVEESLINSHFLEYPHYTRPKQFREHKVPQILLSGHHKQIKHWRFSKRLEKTLENRPELLDEIE